MVKVDLKTELSIIENDIDNIKQSVLTIKNDAKQKIQNTDIKQEKIYIMEDYKKNLSILRHELKDKYILLKQQKYDIESKINSNSNMSNSAVSNHNINHNTRVDKYDKNDRYENHEKRDKYRNDNKDTIRTYIGSDVQQKVKYYKRNNISSDNIQSDLKPKSYNDDLKVQINDLLDHYDSSEKDIHNKDKILKNQLSSLIDSYEESDINSTSNNKHDCSLKDEITKMLYDYEKSEAASSQIDQINIPHNYNSESNDDFIVKQINLLNEKDNSRGRQINLLNEKDSSIGNQINLLNEKDNLLMDQINLLNEKDTLLMNHINELNEKESSLGSQINILHNTNKSLRDQINQLLLNFDAKEKENAIIASNDITKRTIKNNELKSNSPYDINILQKDINVAYKKNVSQNNSTFRNNTPHNNISQNNIEKYSKNLLNNSAQKLDNIINKSPDKKLSNNEKLLKNKIDILVSEELTKNIKKKKDIKDVNTVKQRGYVKWCGCVKLCSCVKPCGCVKPCNCAKWCDCVKPCNCVKPCGCVKPCNCDDVNASNSDSSFTELLSKSSSKSTYYSESTEINDTSSLSDICRIFLSSADQKELKNLYFNLLKLKQILINN